ncbi:Nucleoporin-like protein 2 [Coemansia interrupta]|uniref:Nucleoporin-like protein 2 n=1 Tax=Coemansia interrupta TaxID=1126814 RepID=A0A9W8LJS5_9FUNG|nr:Nucleoporin-like protein 2 [Coemansia interrupta]
MRFFGSRCRNEHPQNRPSAFGQSASQNIIQGGSTPTSNRFSTFSSPGFGNQTSSFSAFANKETPAAKESSGVSADTLLRGISDRPMWKLSCFGPAYNKPNILSGTDISPEEMRLDYMQAASSNQIDACERKYQQLESEVEARISDIKRNTEKYAKDWEMQHGDGDSKPTESGFGKTNAKSAFGSGSSAFGSGSSAFGTSGSAFGSGSSAFGTGASAFGSGNKAVTFGQDTVTTFGANSKPSAFGRGSDSDASSVFGSNASAASTFGSNTSTTPAFGSSTATPAFGTGTKPSAFGTSTTSAFGTGTATPSAFGTGTTSAFGSGTGTTSAFGSGTGTTSAFGSGLTSQKFEFTEGAGPQRPLTADEISMFKADKFVLGSIPEQPPSKELV